MSIELAATAVAALSPYLKEAGMELAKNAGKESASAGVKLLTWMHEKLSGRAKKALSNLEQKPDSELHQDDVRTQLAKLLESQPELIPELRALLTKVKAPGDVMTQTVGEGGIGNQIKGGQNTISISGR